MNATDIATEVIREYTSAANVHPKFNSAHEGYAVILEELEELWVEVMKRHKDYGAMRKEAIQVAAMALRFVKDVCDGREE